MPADCNSNTAIDKRVLRTSRTSIYHFYTFLYISPICLQDQEEVVRQVRHGFLDRACGTTIDKQNKQKKVKPFHGIVFVDVCQHLDTTRYTIVMLFPIQLMHANNTRDVNHSLLVDCIRCHQACFGRRSASEVRSSRFFAFCRNCLELPLSIIFVGIGVQTDPVGRELDCDLGGTTSLGCD